jgi:hypothetical protein
MYLLFFLSTLPSKMLNETIMYHENLECTVHHSLVPCSLDTDTGSWCSGLGERAREREGSGREQREGG